MLPPGTSMDAIFLKEGLAVRAWKRRRRRRTASLDGDEAVLMAALVSLRSLKQRG